MYKNKVISISAEIVAARRDEYLHQWTDLTNPAKGSKDQVKKMV